MNSMTSSCWLYAHPLTKQGYGFISYWDKINKKQLSMLAHRAVYETVYGKIAPNLVIDHLCRVRACINPEHMEAVTNKENILRGESITAKEAKQTHCKHGHPFDRENTYFYPNRTGRQCRICKHNNYLKSQYGVKDKKVVK